MADSENYEIVKLDFDEIADLSEPKWNHNNCYFDYLLGFVPEHVDTILDIGCGKGELSAKLSHRANRVIAVDLSEKMIDRAKALHSRENIEYICGNILQLQIEDDSLDVIITTATAHHLPYEWLLLFAKNKLKRGGALIVLDLVQASSLSDHLLWGFAALPNVLMNLLQNGKLRSDDLHAKSVWDRHGQHDTYMTIKEIKAAANKYLENPVIKRKLFWRYVLVWRK